MVPVPRRAVPVHLVRQPDRLHPAADQHQEKFNIFGAHIPSFALYAATANISVPLVLALVVFVAFNCRGHPRPGPVGYLKSLIPAGVHGPMLLLIFPLEIVSTFMRLISLTVRLFANILAGHLIILFMAGGLAVILGLSFLGWFTLPFGVAVYLFELGLVATLQAFIFATLAAIYLGWRGHSSLNQKELSSSASLHILSFARPPGSAPDSASGSAAAGRRRCRRRHRDHLRQGHRGGDPPAGDARRDHQHPVARLRPDRGAFFYGLVAGLISFVLK